MKKNLEDMTPSERGEILDKMIKAFRMAPFGLPPVFFRPETEDERRLREISEHINKNLRWPL